MGVRMLATVINRAIQDSTGYYYTLKSEKIFKYAVNVNEFYGL